MYKKRDEAALTGAMYKIKLISLLNFRACIDDTIEEFHLAANVDHMYHFGDICFKAKMKGIDKPIEVFIHAKYRQKKNITDKNHLKKLFYSYRQIRQQFDPSNEDLFLKGTFNETECVFVIHTNAIIDFMKDMALSTQPHGCAITAKLKDLIGTGGTDEKIDVQEEHVEFLGGENMKKQIMISLAKQISKLLNDDSKFQELLNDKDMLRYHVILAQEVVVVSEIQPDRHRFANFRAQFFDTKEKYLTIFKDTLLKAVRKKTTTTDQTIKELLSLQFKVPVAFGNKDLIIEGSDTNIKEKINRLASKICKLLENCKTRDKGTIVTVDSSLAGGFVELNGGIAGAIGNLFVSDDNFSMELMKITDNPEQLEPLAQRLYKKIASEVPNLHKYKFYFKISKFPKLSFNSWQYEENLARDFLSRLVLYYNQANVYGVDNFFKNEIKNYLCNQPTTNVKYHFQANTDLIVSRYFDQIHKWWMSSEGAPVLTRKSDLLMNTINEISTPVLLYTISAIFMSKIKQYNYTFTEFAVRTLKLQENSNTIIITENSILTVVKVIQHLKGKAHVLLNFEDVANLSTDDLTALRRELKYTNDDEVLILVCDDIQKEKINTLEMFTVQNRNIMIVTNQTSCKTVQKCFPIAFIVHDKNLRLIDLSEESQMSIFDTATVIHSGVEEDIRLDHLLPKPASRSVGDAAADDETGTRNIPTGSVQEASSTEVSTSRSEDRHVPGSSYEVHEPVLEVEP